MSYCSYVKTLDFQDIHRIYHDKVYGVRLTDDNELFGRLILEINQAGLSWDTILKKQDNFKLAYSQFDILKISSYQDTDIQRLLAESGIIRNRLKILAVINNAKIILEIQKSNGSFLQWLDENNFRVKNQHEIIKIFKQKGFKFVGGEILKEFLMSTGFIDGAHDKDCLLFNRTI